MILDLNLSDSNAISSIHEISDTYIKLPILILSMYPKDPYALQSIQTGASKQWSKKN